MKKFIIGFYGAKNNGKTSSLNRLIGIFCKDDHKISYVNGSTSDDTDQLVCVYYNGINIGIATGGDDGETVSKSIQIFSKKKCDIIITACRTGGGTRYAIDSYKKEYDIHYITCPYLNVYGAEQSEPTKEQLENIYLSSAVFVKSYIDLLFK